jgi:hypothetical protein
MGACSHGSIGGRDGKALAVTGSYRLGPKWQDRQVLVETRGGGGSLRRVVFEVFEAFTHVEALIALILLAS